MLLAWGRSHRTTTDAELVRWGTDLARVEGIVAEPQAANLKLGLGPGPDIEGSPGHHPTTIEVAIVREGPGGGRKRIRVNGVGRRAGALLGVLRIVIFAPEEMLLVSGSPGLRRAAIDNLAAQRSAQYARDLASYGRVLQQRNSLLRQIREEQAGRDELRFWNESFLEAGASLVQQRLTLLADLAGPIAMAHGEIAPEEAAAGAALAIRYATNAPQIGGESPLAALTRRLAETADKEVWNGSTLIGPHRDDIVFEQTGRDLGTFASRGQQRTAILAFKLAELDLLTALDGRPPLLLLDDVFSELDPERRAHLVRRIAALPQAFVTTTTLDDLDPELREHATSWSVTAGRDGSSQGGDGDGARLAGPTVHA